MQGIQGAADIDFAPDADAGEDIFDDPIPEPDFAEEAPLPPIIDAQQSIETPGLEHILHNATNDLRRCMRGYKECVDQMKEVCRLLKSREARQILVERCFKPKGRIGAAMSRDLDGFNAHVHTERWGTVAYAALRLCEVGEALRWGWSLKEYSPDWSARDEEKKDDHNIKVSAVDSAIRSPYFWGYVTMLQIIARVLNTMLLWCDSCSCHWDLLRNAKLMNIDLPFKTRKLWKTCVFRGRRLPELASGDLFAETQQLFEEGSARMARKLPPGLDDAQRATIIIDYERGRSHVVFLMTLKLSHWLTPPWCMYALAHHIPSRAAAAYERLRATPLDAETHPAVRELLTGQLHGQFETWYADHGCCFSLDDGADALIEMRCKLAEFRLAPSADRMIERLHAESQKSTKRAPHHNESYISMTHRLPFIFAEIDKRPAVLEEFAQDMRRSPRPKGIATDLGLSSHPRFNEASSTRDHTFQAIVYSNDPYSKYTWAAPSFDKPDTGEIPQEIVEEATDIAELQRAVMLDHLRSTMTKCDASGAKPFMCMRMSRSAFRVLQSLLLPQHDSSVPKSKLRFLRDGELLFESGPAAAGDKFADWAFCQHLDSISHVRERTRGAARLLSYDISVTVHQALTAVKGRGPPSNMRQAKTTI